MPPRREPSIEQSLIVAAIQEDDDLKQRIRYLARRVIVKAEYLLENGSPMVQQNVMRTIMPAITAALRQEAEDERFEHLKEHFESMLRTAIGVEVDNDLDED